MSRSSGFRFAAAVVSLVVLAAPAAAKTRAAAPVALAPAAADSLRAAYEKDREETREWLRTARTSYLATILRRDFESKASLTVGSAADADVRIEDASVKPHHLRVAVVGDSFRVEALDDGATFAAGGEERRVATLAPGSIGVARFTVRLSHQRFPAIIVFDPQSPRFKDYKGLEWFPVDFAYRYELAITPNPKPDTVVVMSTRGNARHALRAGWFDFAVVGKPCRLEAVRLLEPGVDEKSLGIFFRDATTGNETYGVGRYLDLEPLANGRYVLDFNLAYNPACAVSDHYNCPIPSKANTLKVAIRAGEKDAHYH